MHILIVGDFPDKKKLIEELQRHRHTTATTQDAGSALALVDETEGTFGLVFVHQGASAKWMGTSLATGLRDRCHKIPIAFVLSVEDDDLRIIRLQTEFRSHGIQLYSFHAPLLHLDFIVEELHRGGVVLIGN